MGKIVFNPIGIIHSGFTKAKGTPIQPAAAGGAEGKVEIFKEYTPGLKDLDQFSHIILIFYFHKAKKVSLTATPFMGNKEHGIFAIRGPSRPNAIGISTVRLLGISDNILHIRDVDILEGTPLLDIKPYVPRFDEKDKVKIGWLKNKIHNIDSATDDGRFIV